MAEKAIMRIRSYLIFNVATNGHVVGAAKHQRSCNDMIRMVMMPENL